MSLETVDCPATLSVKAPGPALSGVLLLIAALLVAYAVSFGLHRLNGELPRQDAPVTEPVETHEDWHGNVRTR